MRTRVAWLVGCCLLTLSCSVSDEEKIRGLIDDAVGAARLGDLQALADPVSVNYRDPRGLNRQALLGLVGAYLQGGERLHFLSQTRSIQVGDDDRAEATVLLAIADIPIEDLEMLGRVSAELAWIDLTLERESGEWKLISADWRGATAKDFLIP